MLEEERLTVHRPVVALCETDTQVSKLVIEGAGHQQRGLRTQRPKLQGWCRANSWLFLTLERRGRVLASCALRTGIWR
jgi:hypothetical protein